MVSVDSSPRVVIISPTYNERANLETLVDRVRALGVPNLRLLVVDDNSPDGTGQLADELAQRYPDFVQVLHRAGKLGLASAYLTGFRWALAHDADCVIQMDADLSHPVETVRVFLEKIGEYDVVVGSRWTKGGSLDESWGLSRRVLSWGGNSYARLITGLPFRDVTAGFKCIRSNVLASIALDSIRSEGYAFQVEMACLYHRKGFRVLEVPIHFTDRNHGKSKMSWRIIWEAFWRVLALRA